MNQQIVWENPDVTLPFENKYRDRLCIMGFNQLAEKYGTYNLRELEERTEASSEFQDKIICLEFEDRRHYENPRTGEKIDFGYHLGADFFLPVGSPIYSITDSKFVYFTNNMEGSKPDWGNLLAVNVKDGLFIHYAHLDIQPSIARGRFRQIRKGELIGHIAPGWTKANGLWPAHLHLQISSSENVHGYIESAEEVKLNYLDPFSILGLR